MGEQRVKNIVEPVLAFRVKLDGAQRRSASRRLPVRRSAWAVAAMVTVAIAGLSWFVFQQMKPTPEDASTIPAIAVLPFEDLSSGKDLEYLGDGVAEDIITMLSRFPDLAVVARTSSFAYKGKAVDVRQIGKELGVDYVLEGSVRKEGEKARIVAQLIDATSGEHAWAERFDKAGTDPWALQDEVTGKIIGSLAGERGTIRHAGYRKAWGKDTTELEEYDYYLRGHEQLMTFTKEGTEQAGRIWREGLAKYPGSSLLTVKLAWYHVARAANFFSDDPPSDFRQAGNLGRQVLANEHLSPQVAKLVHSLMAWVLIQEKDFDGAVAAVGKTVALAPYDTFPLCDLAIVLVQAGQPQQALEIANAAVARDPGLGWFCNYGKGWALLALGEYENAREALMNAAFLDTPLLLAIVYVHTNRLSDARAEVAKMQKDNPAVTVESWRQGYSFRDTTILEGFAADLTQAGLPKN